MRYGGRETPRHEVFISYHHAGDQFFKDEFVHTFEGAFVDHSVRTGDIDDSLSTERIRQIIRDELIRDATVTVVLIGYETWKRKHVDWEIDASLRATRYNPRTGLVGILLPSYRMPPTWVDGVYRHRRQEWADPPATAFCPNNVPPRLWDNVERGFATIRPWPASNEQLAGWIHQAFRRRDENPPPDLSRDRYAKNRSDADVVWS